MANSSIADDYKRLRLAAGRRAANEARPPVAGAPAFVGQVRSAAALIAVGRFLLVEPSYALGAEAEGGDGSLNVGTGSLVPVYLLGPSVPATGEFLICRFVDHRWVAERGRAGLAGPPPIAIPSCSCPVPAKLKMASVPPGGNHGMFQSGTITYQDTPSWAADLGLPPKIFLSDQPFPDPLDGAAFYYYFYCRNDQFLLTRLYPVSPYGSPYRDALLYSWLLGGSGNSCDPFHLDGGKPYPGSDPCSVQINPA